MNLLKRFELWILLILIGGGLLYVFNIQPVDTEQGRRPINPDPGPSTSIPSDQPKSPPRFSLQKTTVTKDDDHFLVEIDLLCRNRGNQALELSSPGTRLLAAGGREAPAFFLPFHSPALVPESGEKTVTLRYWLSHDNINGPLSLLIHEDTIPIKTGKFDPDHLSDKQSQSFTNTDWNLST